MAHGLEQAPFKGMKKGETKKANPGIFASFMGEFQTLLLLRIEMILVERDGKEMRGRETDASCSSCSSFSPSPALWDYESKHSKLPSSEDAVEEITSSAAAYLKKWEVPETYLPSPPAELISYASRRLSFSLPLTSLSVFFLSAIISLTTPLLRYSPPTVTSPSSPRTNSPRPQPSSGECSLRISSRRWPRRILPSSTSARLMG